MAASMSAFGGIVFSNSGTRCQALHDILAGPTVLSAVGASPPHDGVRRRWLINVASAVSLFESSQTIGRSHQRHRPGRDVSSRSVAELKISLCSSSSNLLVVRPVELGPVDPHAVQDDCELARNGNLGLAQPVAFGEPRAPSLQRRPFRYAGQQYAGRLEQIHAEHGVSTLGYPTGPIELSRCMTPSR